MKKFIITTISTLAIVLSVSAPLSLATAPTASASSGINSQSLLSLTNSQRHSLGKRMLHLNSRLMRAAQAKAADMVANNYWAHYSPSGKSPWQFISATGYRYHAAGENLAYGFSTSNEVMTGWMNSPSHKQNVLNSRYTDVGFAVVNAPDFLGQGPETIVVAEYAAH